MRDVNNNYQKPFIFAIALHLLLLIILITHFEFLPKPNPVLQNSASVINAVVVNASQLPNPMPPAKAVSSMPAREQPNQQPAQLQQQPVRQQTVQPVSQQSAQSVEQKAIQEKTAQLAQEKLAEEKAVAEKIAEQKAQAEQAAALKAQQKKAKAEQQKLAQLALQQALQQEQEAEQRQQKQEKQQKQMQAAKLAAQQLLQQQLAMATDNSVNAASSPVALSAAAQGQVDKYSALIISAISQQWIVPDSAQKNLQGQLQVKLAPGGMVIDVSIIKSSGDPAFDRSVRAAVFKASPLPVPKEANVFNQFRILNLTFRPQGISNT